MKKTLILLAALALSTAGTSFAQTTPATSTGKQAHHGKGNKTPAQKADRHAAKMAKELGLNTDQENRLEQLMLTRQQESEALKAKYSTNKQAGRAEMKAAHERYETQLKQILSPEQYAKYQQKKDEHHGHGKMHDAGKAQVKTKA